MSSRGHALRLVVCATFLLLAALPAKAQTNRALRPTQLGRGYVSNIVWSPRGEKFGVATLEGIWLYSREMKLISHLNAPSAFDLAWNSKGTKLLTSHKGHLLSWDVAASRVIADITSPRELETPIMAWNPDGDGFALSWDGEPPQFWHEGEGRPFLRVHSDWTETPQSINKFVWTAQTLIGFSTEGTLFVWKFRNRGRSIPTNDSTSPVGDFRSRSHHQSHCGCGWL